MTEPIEAAARIAMNSFVKSMIDGIRGKCDNVLYDEDSERRSEIRNRNCHGLYRSCRPTINRANNTKT